MAGIEKETYFSFMAVNDFPSVTVKRYAEKKALIENRWERGTPALANHAMICKMFSVGKDSTSTCRCRLWVWRILIGGTCRLLFSSRADFDLMKVAEPDWLTSESWGSCKTAASRSSTALGRSPSLDFRNPSSNALGQSLKGLSVWK